MRVVLAFCEAFAQTRGGPDLWPIVRLSRYAVSYRPRRFAPVGPRRCSILRKSLQSRFAACFTAPSHCLPQGSGRGIVTALTGASEGAYTDFVQLLSKGRSMSVMGQTLHLRRKSDVCFTPEIGHWVADAVAVEPVSASKFSPTRQIYRKLSRRNRESWRESR
jgi:hypothetical protein